MKQKDIIILLVPAAIVILIWVIFSIYHSSVSSTISPILNNQISLINPSFDVSIISKLKQREKVNPIYESKPIGSPAPESSINIASFSGTQLNAPVNASQSTISGGLTQ